MSIHKKMGLAAVVMMASVFLSRIIGLLREMVIAYIGGASAAVDAYQVAFVIPEILNHIAASGFLSVTFIPIFSRYLAQDREAEGWDVFSVVFTGFGALLLLLIAVSMICTPQLVSLIAPGIESPVVRAQAVRMTRIILPAQFFFFAGGLLMAVQFAKERFLLPAMAPLIYNGGIILGGLLLGPRIGMEGFSWGVLAGSLLGNFSLQYYGAKKAGLRMRFRIDLSHPDLKRYVKLTLPLMVGLTMTFSTEFFFKFFGSYLPRGSIAGLNYALRVMMMMVAFFGQAVGVASYPFMARMAAENKLSDMNRILDRTLQYLAVILPISALFIVLRKEIVFLLFQRGRFGPDAAAFTAEVLLYLLIGAFAFATQTIVVRGYYAVQNTIFPTVFGSIAVLISIPIYYLGMHLMGARGVALAVSLSAMLQVGLLYILWARRFPAPGRSAVYRSYGLMAVIALAVGAILSTIKTYALSGFSASTVWQSMLVCLVIGTVFVTLMLGIGYFFKIREITLLADRLIRR